ncbi:polymeric immunoglobulin receptor isoform X2 [Callorhinchus milii]|uniref:polymeric immunoglobulin receptor isoform X2 n=1 Tax=Callorhinchus milii TaxID=7868 RepID=UPI001C3F75EE|nr:polymeric immunoglobulin receptor isoform X2 [Callorhinchus milii]
MWISSLETMKLLALLLLTFISGSSGRIESKVLMAKLGENIIIKCQYPKVTRKSRNCLCKQTKDNYCNYLVCTDGDFNTVYDERASMTGSNDGPISAAVKTLEEKDTGIYWCGKDNGKTIEISEVVLLKVFKGTEKPMKRLVAAELGERISVTCQYSKKLSDYSKFFCKVISNNECTRIADSNGAVNEPYKRRVSITHKGKSQVISIISAKEEDAGEYWCGAASGNEVEFTQVKILQISHGSTASSFIDTTFTTAITRPINSFAGREWNTWDILRWIFFGVLALCPVSVLISTHFSKSHGNDGDEAPIGNSPGKRQTSHY